LLLVQYSILRFAQGALHFIPWQTFHFNTILTSLRSIQACYNKCMKSFCTQISNIVYIQVFIHTADWTGAMSRVW